VVAYFNLLNQGLPRRICENRHSRYTTTGLRFEPGLFEYETGVPKTRPRNCYRSRFRKWLSNAEFMQYWESWNM